MWNKVIDAQVYVVEKAKATLCDWQDACRICNTSCAQPRQEGNVEWINAIDDKFKCYIDVFSSQLSNIICIRDDTWIINTSTFSPSCLIQWKYEFV